MESIIAKVKKKWLAIETLYGKERAIICGSIVVAVALALFIAHSEQAPPPLPSGELGVIIPAGQLIVPLEMANSSALNGLITRNAVIDLFKTGEQTPIVEGLRILKLYAGEGPLFGALVPEKMAGQLQDVFANPKLRGAIKGNGAGPTRFHLHSSTKTSILEIQTGD